MEMVLSVITIPKEKNYENFYFVVQFARSREAHPFGAAFGSRSGGCHAARMFVFRFSGFVIFMVNSF